MIDDDFAVVRDAFDDSIIGRVFSGVVRHTRSAWRSSLVGDQARSIGARLAVLPARSKIRTAAIAIAIASGMQPLLMLTMPRTVVPAVPAAAFFLVTLFALATAWQAGAIAASWPASSFARALRISGSFRPTPPSRE